MPKPGSKGHGKSGHLSDRLHQKAPRRDFTFTFSQPQLDRLPSTGKRVGALTYINPVYDTCCLLCVDIRRRTSILIYTRSVQQARIKLQIASQSRSDRFLQFETVYNPLKASCTNAYITIRMYVTKAIASFNVTSPKSRALLQGPKLFEAIFYDVRSRRQLAF